VKLASVQTVLSSMETNASNQKIVHAVRMVIKTTLIKMAHGLIARINASLSRVVKNVRLPHQFQLLVTSRPQLQSAVTSRPVSTGASRPLTPKNVAKTNMNTNAATATPVPKTFAPLGIQNLPSQNVKNVRRLAMSMINVLKRTVTNVPASRK
jgi:hypothetical protein